MSSRSWSSRPAPRPVDMNFQYMYRQHTDHRFENSKTETDRQIAYLDTLCKIVISDIEITKTEIEVKESFRLRLESICRKAISNFESAKGGLDMRSGASTIQLLCFGSLSSGLATKDSDMDLGLISSNSVIPDHSAGSIPRLIEKALLDEGMGARLLTRTRVPILKLCEKPSEALRQDLLEERDKWEKSQLGSDTIQEFTADNGEHRPIVNIYEPAAKESISSLHQTEGKSLWAYYNEARTLLTVGGGRDITAANWNEFSMAEYPVLERVCRLFVEGLANPALKSRIQKLPSFSQSAGDSRQPGPRSLAGVYIEIEGEHIIATIETRVIMELRDTDEHLINDMVSHWRDIQQGFNRGIDPVQYSKELQVAVDRFKSMPSIRLALLEQKQTESATQYHRRAANIISSIRPLDSHGLTPLERAGLVGHYITGIRNMIIKNSVTTWVASLSEPGPPLDFVASAHKVFELLHAFELCLEEGSYPTTVCEDIQAYIRYLRESMQCETAVRSGSFIMLPPASRDVRALVERIATLGCPLSILQPHNRHGDKLEFPKSGVGVQCDVNFSVSLALHNTLLLRCYCLCDERVRTLILFVKHWAKVRGINSGYRGTLCSYGYALMVLHYLINIVQPYVCPNLQLIRGPSTSGIFHVAPGRTTTSTLDGYDITFWRNEEDISRSARNNELSINTDSIGHLLRGFFEYYAHTGRMSSGQARGFDWGRDVVSIRTPGGLLTKKSKGWTGARTVFEVCHSSSLVGGSRISNDNLPSQGTTGFPPSNHSTTQQLKEVRHRYLFALEDPFELDHNVARTVTHHGIVAIRDEFRRAWRIIREKGQNRSTDHLMAEVDVNAHNANASKSGNSESDEVASFHELLRELHGISR